MENKQLSEKERNRYQQLFPQIKLNPCVLVGTLDDNIYCWVPKLQLKNNLFNYLLGMHPHTCCLLKLPAF
jgi:hypothetical protein